VTHFSGDPLLNYALDKNGWRQEKHLTFDNTALCSNAET